MFQKALAKRHVDTAKSWMRWIT